MTRPAPERLHLDSYPNVVVSPSRYADMDVNGHMNNLALEALHEDARARQNRQIFPNLYDVGARSFRIVTAQNLVHFLAEAHWPADVTAAAGIGHIGRTSYTSSTGLFIDGVCVSTCDAVLVLLGDDGPVPIPDEARVLLASFAIGAAR